LRVWLLLLLRLFVVSFLFFESLCGFPYNFDGEFSVQEWVECSRELEGKEVILIPHTRFGRFRFVVSSLFCITKEKSNQVDSM
jgi:hypothetical protein